jgi:molecular chaperone GrpE
VNEQAEDRQPPVDAGEEPVERPCEAEAETSSETTATVAETRPAPDVVAEVRSAVQETRDGIEQRVAGLESAIEDLASRVSLIPSQVRQLSGKVDGLGTSIAEPRCRGLLLGILGIYDLLGPATRGGNSPEEEMSVEDHCRNRHVLRTQVRQLLETNGLAEIATDGDFDPENHHAVDRIACNQSEEHNRIVEVVRSGFRTPQAVLRYAEVVVACHDTQKTPPGDATATEKSAPSATAAADIEPAAGGAVDQA